MISPPSTGCACQHLGRRRGGSQGSSHDEALSGLYDRLMAVRRSCWVLRELFIPETILHNYRAWCLETQDPAHHKPHVFLAFESGQLTRLTRLMHRFVDHFEDLRKQYRKDLVDKWMGQADVMERHHKGKSFMGKIAEFEVADYLADQGWAVHGMEATGDRFDIVCSHRGKEVILEVKRVGMSDQALFAGVHSMAGGKAELDKPYKKDPGGAVWPVSPYASANYLLFRMAEAAHQLVLAPDQGSRPMIAIVLESLTWEFFKVPFSWIHWESPHFLDGDLEWLEFWNRQGAKKRGDVLRVLPEIANIGCSLLSERGYELTLRERKGPVPL